MTACRMKVVSLVTRRDGMSRKAFRDYYETHHAALSVQYFPFEKYVRNHLADAGEIGFDCIMECWIDHQKALGILTGKVERIFAEDERKFMQRRARGVEVEEILVTGQPRDLDSPNLCKEILIVQNASGAGGKELSDSLMQWGRALAADAGGKCLRMTIDRVTGMKSDLLDGDALLTAWLSTDEAVLRRAAPPPDIKILAAVLSQPYETAQPQLAEGFGPGC